MSWPRRLAGASLCLTLALPALASADTWDINLGRLCVIETQSKQRLDCGGGYRPSQTDPITGVIPDNVAFRSLMSELGAVFAPNILYPSDTRGWSGFNVSTEFGWTGVSNKKLVRDPVTGRTNYLWRAAGSVSGRTFANPAGPDEARYQQEAPPSFAPTMTLIARKGFWMPVPSAEIGIGVRHLFGSSMWAPLVTAKIALHEGFHGWPIPSLAIRGTGSRVIGTPGFNLTTAGLDFSVSKRVGIASTFNLTPYTGYQLLWIVADAEIIDATPAIDAIGTSIAEAGNDPLLRTQCRAPDCRANFTFTDQSNITRHRFFFGLRANFYIVSLFVEYTFFASGSASNQVANTAGIPVESDEAGFQHTINFGLGLDY